MSWSGDRSVWQSASYAMALLIVAAALGAGLHVRPFLGLENINLLFLTAVVGVAVRYGLWPSLLACVAASLAYNFFFLPPLYTFTVADPENVVALFFLLLVAVIVSNLAAHARMQAVAAQNRARTPQALYTFSRKIADVAGLDDLLWATAGRGDPVATRRTSAACRQSRVPARGASG